MFTSYEEAMKYIEARRNSSRPVLRACYIMTKDGRYNVAYGQEEKEYAESLGYTLATN